MRRLTLAAAIFVLLAVGLAFAAAKPGTIKVVGNSGRNAKASSASVRVTGPGGLRTISGTKSLPVGTYRVRGGQVTVKGTKQGSTTAYISYDTPMSVRVQSGKTRTVTIGGPMVINVAQESSSIAIDRGDTEHLSIAYTLKSGGNIMLSGPGLQDAQIKVLNSAGKVVQKGAAGFSWGGSCGYSVRVPKNWKPGVYTIQVSYNTGAYQGVVTSKRSFRVR